MKRLLVGIALVAAGAAPLRGQGFSVYSHSACMAGRGGTGVAAPCGDASTVYYNPAGLAALPSTLAAGVTAIRLGGEFTFDYTGEDVEQETRTTAVPHLYANYRWRDRVAIGLGVFAPYGLALEWPADFRGAFSGHDVSLAGLYVQPTLAVQLTPSLLLGAGLDVVRSTVDLTQALDLAAVETPAGLTLGALGIPSGTAFADARLQGTAWAVTMNAGALLRLSEMLSLGVRYTAEVENEFDDGSATFTPRETGLRAGPDNPFGLPVGTPLEALVAAEFAPGGSLTDQEVTTSITYPAQAALGVRVRPIPTLSLLADYLWTDWSAFREITLEFERLETATLIEDYEDTHTFRVGAEWTAREPWLLRAGYSYNDAAAPAVTVTPLLPEAERAIFYGGLGYRASDRFGIDAFFALVDQASRRGRLLPRESRELGAEELNEGVFSGSAFEIGATLSFRFGRR